MKKLVILLTAVTVILGLSAMAADLVIESKSQSYSEKDNKIKFDGDVNVTLDALRVVGDKADIQVLKGNKLDVATFYNKPYAFEIKDNKKREVKANILKLSLINKVLKAEGDAQASVVDGLVPVVVITADYQEYDTKTNLMKANGKVIIHYSDLETFSEKAIIQTDKQGKLKKIDLIGNAKVKEKLNTSEADHFIYDPIKERLIAMGNTTSRASMEDGTKLVLKSKYQQYDRKTNTFMGSGNVRIWYQDYFAQGPEVSFYPDAKTKKPNEIYFTGRSSITQTEKTIYADKIKLILRPKMFYADGNVRSVIKNVSSDEKKGEFGL